MSIRSGFAEHDKKSVVDRRRRNTRAVFAVIALLVLTSLFAFAVLEKETSDAAPISASNVVSDILALPDGGTYTFAGEPDGVITLNISDNHDRIIDGNNLTLPCLLSAGKGIST
ncbi:MAG: hypothetical protein LBU30_05440 [Candidatus Methanoplasma sp.]|nr:hypothetical protein [Candidatus Methanoplasma sp.]